MKKFISTLTILIMGVILFAGCTESNVNVDGNENGYKENSVPEVSPENDYTPQEDEPQANAFELFQQMAANMLSLDSLYTDISDTLHISAYSNVLSGGVDTVHRVAELVIKEVFRNETTDFHRTMSTSINVLGGVTLQTMQYVVGGVLYEYTEGFGRHRIELSAISAEMPYIVAQGMFATYVYDFPESAIRYYTINSQDDNIQMTLTLNGEALTGLVEFSQFARFTDFIELAIRQLYAAGVIDELYIDVGDIIYDLLIDENGILILYRMTANEISIRVNDDIVYMTFDVFMMVNSYNDVVIDFPDDLHEWGN